MADSGELGEHLDNGVGAALSPAARRLLPAWPFRKIVLGGLTVAMALAIGVLPMPLAAALAVGLTVVGLILVRIDTGLWLLALLVPFGSVLPIAFGQLSLTVADFLVGLVFMAWLIRGLSLRQMRAPFAGVLVPLVAFFAVLLLATTSALSIDACYKELLRWLELILVYIVVSNHVTTLRRVNLLVAMILVAGSAEALVGFYQFFTQTGPESFVIGRFMRAYGTFSQPNPFAGYLGLVLPLGVAVALVPLFRPVRVVPASADEETTRRGLDKKGSWARVGGGAHGVSLVFTRVPFWLRLLALACCALAGAAMLMSLSRGALLGAVAALAVMAAVASRRTLTIAVVGLVVLALVLLLGAFSLLPQQVAVRLSQMVEYFGVFDVRSIELTAQNWAIVERMARWQAAWNMFVNNPWLGVGLGNYAVAYESYALPGWPDPLGHAHNFYLNMMAETGVVGAGAYLALVAIWFWHGLQVLRRASGPLFTVVVGLLGILMAAAVHNLFDNLYVHNMNIQVGLTLGLLTAIGGMAKSGER